MGAFGGRKDIMKHVAPAGNMYQAGTLSGNPLAMTAGIKTLEILKRPGSYEHLDKVRRERGVCLVRWSLGHFPTCLML